MKTLRKLNSNRGETLVEVLVAVLISALALVMFAAMISTATRLTVQSKNTLKVYYSNNAILESKISSSGEDATITVSTSGTGTNLTDTIPVKVYTNIFSKTEVIAYGKGTS